MRPFVSIIVLNYNGERFLSQCLSSLENVNYPKDRHEVIVVDNASSDGSMPLIRQAFPWVRVIRNPENFGFSRGNNVGIKAGKGEFIALLNNDTYVAPDWLSALVAAAARDLRVGLCTSKIYLFDRRVELALSCAPFSPAAVSGLNDRRKLGVCIESAKVVGGAGEVEFLGGFYPVETRGEESARWSSGSALIGIPVSGDETEVLLEISFAPYRPREADPLNLEIRAVRDSTLLFRLAATKEELPKNCRVVLGREVVATARPVIQNAGSIIFPDGSGRDRGAVVQGTHQYYESDLGQYDASEEVFGACGASMLMRREMLEDAGLLDESFFMYYEDTDLSWRARLRGWKVVYVPSSIVWHAHCGTSVEWSPFFVFHTDRNRLAMVAKNGTIAQVLATWVEYFCTTVLGCGRLLLQRLRLSPSKELEGRVFIKLKVVLSLVRSLPHLLSQRWKIQRGKSVGHKEIARWFHPK